MYAIIETGGKQYKVCEGDIITVASAATVDATVMGDGKAKKVIVYKYKPKKGFHKKNGHRQPFTQLKIEKING